MLRRISTRFAPKQDWLLVDRDGKTLKIPNKENIPIFIAKRIGEVKPNKNVS